MPLYTNPGQTNATDSRKKGFGKKGSGIEDPWDIPKDAWTQTDKLTNIVARWRTGNGPVNIVLVQKQKTDMKGCTDRQDFLETL